MNLETLITISTIGAFFGLALLERVFRGYSYPTRPLWALRGVAWLLVAFVVASTVPLLTDSWLAEHAVVDLSDWGLWGVLPAMLAYQLLGYAYHRALHGIPWLWRLHQTHHASERIDIWSAQRFHPLDIAGWTIVGSAAAIGVFGVSTEAALVNALIVNVVAWFGHTNLRTPRWLGYVVARPENHALHHARGVHRKNYADFPIIDMLFGTFENPTEAPRAAGFYDGASDRLGALLLGLDVTEPAPTRARLSPSNRSERTLRSRA